MNEQEMIEEKKSLINSALNSLAKDRWELEGAELLKQEYLSKVKLIPGYQEVEKIIEARKKSAENMEALIRQAAIDVYALEKEKTINKFVGIRVQTKLKYVIEEAELWSRENLQKAFHFDREFFEKHAKAVKETAPIGFVEFMENPQTTIATDLSELLPQAGTPESEVAK
jgi:hypothetical protein